MFSLIFQHRQLKFEHHKHMYRHHMGDQLDTVSALFERASAREWPVCASWRPGEDNLCFFSDDDGKYLNASHYDPTNPDNPKHQCNWCRKPLHCALCSHTPKPPLLCVTCAEKTRELRDRSAGNLAS